MQPHAVPRLRVRTTVLRRGAGLHAVLDAFSTSGCSSSGGSRACPASGSISQAPQALAEAHLLDAR
jgi:hypothetical protein